MDEEHICLFNSAKAWGGGEKWHFDAATYMHSQQISVLSAAHGKGELLKRLKNKNIPVSAIDISNLSFLNAFKIMRLIAFFKKKRVKTIILNMPADVKAAGIAARLAGVKHIIYRRGSDIPIKNTLLNRLLFRYVVTGIISNSEATKKSINQNTTLFPPENITVIYNGIDTKAYENLKQRKFDNKKIIIGNLGRMVHQKGHQYLIETAKILKARKIDFSLVIGGDGPLKKELLNQAIAAGVSDRIEFEGFVENPVLFMEKIDVFVLSSRWEGFGYVIAEAMLAGKPVIAFDVSSNPELIGHGKTGFLVPAFDIENLAECIIHLYQNPGFIISMGQNGREEAIARFSKQSMNSKLLEYLEQFG